MTNENYSSGARLAEIWFEMDMPFSAFGEIRDYMTAKERAAFLVRFQKLHNQAAENRVIDECLEKV